MRRSGTGSAGRRPPAARWSPRTPTAATTSGWPVWWVRRRAPVRCRRRLRPARWRRSPAVGIASPIAAGLAAASRAAPQACWRRCDSAITSGERAGDPELGRVLECEHRRGVAFGTVLAGERLLCRGGPAGQRRRNNAGDKQADRQHGGGRRARSRRSPPTAASARYGRDADRQHRTHQHVGEFVDIEHRRAPPVRHCAAARRPRAVRCASR